MNASRRTLLIAGILLLAFLAGFAVKAIGQTAPVIAPRTTGPVAGDTSHVVLRDLNKHET